MYAVSLVIHNLLRWLVLLLGILAASWAWLGWFGKRAETRNDRLPGVLFTAGMDVQLLLGLMLYFFLSPITSAAFNDFGAAMSNAGQRFFLVEHGSVMLLAILLGHLGSIFSRKAGTAVSRHKRAAIWYSLALLALMAGIPWWRPLLPNL